MHYPYPDRGKFLVLSPKKWHCKKEVVLQPIDTEFDLGRYHYTQIERHANLAVYRQQHKDNPKVVRYEVIRIRVQREHTWPTGVVTPEKEAYPASGDWGKYGFTCFTLAEAQALLTDMMRQQPEPKDDVPPSPIGYMGTSGTDMSDHDY